MATFSLSRTTVSVCLLVTQAAMATDWIGVDDFNALAEGDVLAVAPTWQSISGFEPARVVTPDDGNPVAQIEAGQALATNIPGEILAIPEGQSGVIFLKFRAMSDSRYWGGVFGMASNPPATPDDLNVAWTLGNPGQGSRPNATFAILHDSGQDVLVKNRGRMNRAYDDVEPEIEPEVWYNLWVTIDNSRDEVRMYIQGGDFSKRTELTHFRNAKKNVFQFQTASASDLTHFVILNPTDAEVSHNPRSIQVDNITYYLQTAPSAVAEAN